MHLLCHLLLPSLRLAIFFVAHSPAEDLKFTYTSLAGKLSLLPIDK